MRTMDKNIFINKYIKAIENSNAAIFAGAGLSASAGFVNWKELLRDVAIELGLDIEKEHDLVSLAQYHVNENHTNKNTLNEIILNNFFKNVNVTQNHHILSCLPIYTYWTTNYDKLIEKSLEQNGKVVDIKSRIDDLKYLKDGRDVSLYKMHGDVEHPDDCILIKDEYERYHKDNEAFVTALSGDLLEKTFLFLGFSFTDPNLDYVLSRVRISLQNKHNRDHYCILKKINEDDFDNKADYHYANRRQELFVGDLMRNSIKVILIDDYKEITNILKTIEIKLKRKTVFISGSADEYEPFGDKISLKFVKKLSENLIKNNFKIVSGFGLGIGSSVVSGALTEIYMNQKKTDSSQLILRPFPYNEDGENKEELWHKYREDMIGYSGIAIFVFGNKTDDNGQIIYAEGVKKEFEIAKKQGCFLIPVGATGYMAKKLFEEIENNFDEYYPDITDENKKLLLSLKNIESDINLNSIKDKIFNLIINLQK